MAVKEWLCAPHAVMTSVWQTAEQYKLLLELFFIVTKYTKENGW